jgi:hypothetical protein
VPGNITPELAAEHKLFARRTGLARLTSATDQSRQNRAQNVCTANHLSMMPW